MNVNTIPDFNCVTAGIDMTVSVVSTGGPLAPPYTVNIVPIGVTSVVTSNSFTFSNLPTMTAYSVFVTNGICSGYGAGYYVIPTVSTNITITNTMVSCFGGNNGAASAVYSGQAPFTWQWSTGSTNSTVNNLSIGVYTVSITDSRSCTATREFTVTEPPDIASTLSTTFVPCFGGTISSVVSSTGGVSPFTYTVNGTAVTSNTANNLPAGTQTIITKDNKGCIKTNTIFFSQASQQVITPTIVIPSCPGKSDAAINVSVQGTIPGYTYTWLPGNSSGTSINNIPAGNYTLSVKDNSACVTKSIITVVPASSIVAGTVIQKENCSAVDGAFTLSINGGYPPYLQTTLPTNASGTVVTGLSSGTYTTVITDSHGCIDSLAFYIGNLSTVSLTAVKVNSVECYNTCNGSILLNVQNAIMPVTYSLTGLPTTTANVVTNLCAGLYIIRAIDAIGCPSIDTVNFPTPPVFTYSALVPPTICIGSQSSLQAFANGGTGAHTFIWNPGAMQGATVNVSPLVTTVYSLNVYDSKNCTLAPFQVTVPVRPALSININSSNSGICPGTTAQITPTINGGDGNYTYTWVPGYSRGASIFVENITIPTYTLSVADGCGSPTTSKEIILKLHPVTKPTYVNKGDSGCVPLCTQFINTTPRVKNVVWNFGDKPFEQTGDTTKYCYENSGNFNLKITVTDSNTCKSSFTYSNAVYVLVRPKAGFVTEPGIITLNDADNVLIKNSSTNGSAFKWYMDDVYLGTKKDIYQRFTDTGCYDIKLIVENADRCKDSTIRSICVFEGFNFYMPRAFTPNNDGLNDVLLPKGTGWLYDKYVFEVYNRWGHKIYSTRDVYSGWDGGIKTDAVDPDISKTNPNDVYHWRVVVTDNLLEEHVFTGYVALIR